MLAHETEAEGVSIRPVIKNYDPELTRSLAEAIEEAGFELISRWILVWEPWFGA